MYANSVVVMDKKKCEGALKTQVMRCILELFKPVTSKEDIEEAALTLIYL